MKRYLFEDISLSIPENKDEIRRIFTELISRKEPAAISFINPEIFLAQQRNPELHEYFRQTEYNFIDGIGLLRAINKKLGTHYGTESRFPGTDFFDYLPEDRTIRIYLYGSRIENLENAKIKLEEMHPNIRIIEWTFGYTKFDGDFLVEKINAAKPEILIVCKGCPLQEKWIADNKEKLNVPLIFGNGGAVDFWSESVKRAPDFMIRHGLEWLYRLFASFSFKRIKRQLHLVRFLADYTAGKYEIKEMDAKEETNASSHIPDVFVAELQQ